MCIYIWIAMLVSSHVGLVGVLKNVSLQLLVKSCWKWKWEHQLNCQPPSFLFICAIVKSWIPRGIYIHCVWIPNRMAHQKPSIHMNPIWFLSNFLAYLVGVGLLHVPTIKKNHLQPIPGRLHHPGVGVQRGGLLPQRAQGGRLPARPLPRRRPPLERRRLDRPKGNGWDCPRVNNIDSYLMLLVINNECI